MTKTLKIIASYLSEFNKKEDINLRIFLKGSYIHWAKKLIEREPNDLDFGFLNGPLIWRQKFISFLLAEKFAEPIRVDDNLKILKINKINVEFILLETLPEEFLEKTKWENIWRTSPESAFFRKILMISYVLDDVYPHDRNQKMTSIVSDLTIFWNKFSNKSLLEYSRYKKEFLVSSWNSFFIYLYYNYNRMLEIHFNPRKLDKYFENILPDLKDFIYGFFTYLKETKSINNLAIFFDKIQKNIGKINKLLTNFLNFPSLTGFEAPFIKKILNKKITKDTRGGTFSLNNPEKNTLFISHADEAGGIAINGQVFNQGSPYWESGIFEVFDKNSVKINEITCQKVDNLIFSDEKQRKINRTNLLCDKINHKEIYQILPKSNLNLGKFVIWARNHDNKISNLVLKTLVDFISDANIVLTTKEEIQLQGTKDKELIQEVENYKFLINLDVSEDENWDVEGIKIRVADPFMAYNSDIYEKVKNLFDENGLEFRPFFGSGSTDITNFQNQNSITLSIPASKIHSNNSKILLKNFFYLLWICKEINDKFH
ncbi:hypothetical protein [Mesomycoplasma hyopneumoniae]|uniref:hypothetical protein n=1 Tax=Mesomycoplasma hyopneumoniae TaxID=2099 RepID=UPI003857A264